VQILIRLVICIAGLSAGGAQAQGIAVAWGDAPKPPGSVGASSPGAASAIAAGSGSGRSCAIQAGTGALVCWGNDAVGRARAPASVDGTDGGAFAVAVEGRGSLAIAVPEPNSTALALATVLTLTLLRCGSRVLERRGLEG
jgi:hypothetical protein